MLLGGVFVLLGGVFVLLCVCVCVSRVSAKKMFFRRWNEQNREIPLCFQPATPADGGPPTSRRSSSVVHMRVRACVRGAGVQAWRNALRVRACLHAGAEQCAAASKKGKRPAEKRVGTLNNKKRRCARASTPFTPAPKCGNDGRRSWHHLSQPQRKHTMRPLSSRRNSEPRCRLVHFGSPPHRHRQRQPDMRGLISLTFDSLFTWDGCSLQGAVVLRPNSVKIILKKSLFRWFLWLKRPMHVKSTWDF